MKKLLIPILLLSLLLAGCAALQTVQDKVCGAPPEVVAVADTVIGLLKPVASALVPGSAPFVALVTAQGIKDTGCAALTGLNTLIAFIQAHNADKLAQAQAGKKAAPKLLDDAPLLEWRDKK